MKIAYSFGIVDLLHYGHINAIKKAAKDADLHIFGLVSDGAATEWNGPIVSNEIERREVLESIMEIDEVMLQSSLDPTENLIKLHSRYPNAKISLFHGSDWAIFPAMKYLESIGGSIETFDYYEKLSPLNILNILNSRFSGYRRSNIISTKANTLYGLSGKLKKSYVEDVNIVTIGEFRKDSARILGELAKKYSGHKLVVRSSSKNEDCYETSNAGHFTSVLDVEASNTEEVKVAVSKVIDSYGCSSEDPDEQILIQPQTENVKLSGVAFTRDIQQNKPYYVINYDDSGSTDSVTSGLASNTIWVAHDAEDECIPREWLGLIHALREIEGLLSQMMLDIEFAVKTSGEVVIFQVRPLAASYKFKRVGGDEAFLKTKLKAKEDFSEFFNKDGRTILSDMAFWNPSEIIGDNPRNLDYSLYRKIITKAAWSKGLAMLGYTLVEDDLMYRVGNKPYICVDHSFATLIPERLDKELKGRLVEFYRDKLRADLTSHDKIEFEIVLSCFDFSLKRKLRELNAAGFSNKESQDIYEALKELTVNCIKDFEKTSEKDRESINQLNLIKKEKEKLLGSDIPVGILATELSELLEAIERFGTEQFSRQARYAFISKSICMSLVAEGFISQKESDDFMTGIETVATEFERDSRAYEAGSLSKETFDEKYGHLRAGTYNIRAKRYDEMEFCVRESNTTGPSVHKGGFELSQSALQQALERDAIDVSYEELLTFMKKAIEQRELFKFEFTKSLSLAIELIKFMGSKCGLCSEELSYLGLSDVLAASFYGSDSEIGEFWRMMSEKRKEIFERNSLLVLPPVMQSEEDIDFIKLTKARPNFVTAKILEAETVVLEKNEGADISGKIVVLEKADPGYDWIFSKGIAGLVTKYGGVASHMSIRCAEFGLPAAIGCGEQIFSFIRSAERLRLNCSAKKIEKI